MGEEVEPKREMESKQEVETKPKAPRLFRNYISFAGAAIAVASFACILLLFLIDLFGTGHASNPYVGIFTYIIFPSIMVFGLMVIPFGMILERRRRRLLSPEEIAKYPTFDLNDPTRRRNFFVFLAVTTIFIFMSAFGSYRAYEFSDSVTFCGQTCHTVMKPELSVTSAPAQAGTCARNYLARTSSTL